MWVQAVMVVLFFLAVASSVVALARYAPTLWPAQFYGPNEPISGPQTSPAAPVRPQQDHADQDQTADFEMVAAWVGEHNLTDEQAIVLLARARRSPDDYFLSANKIRDAVGGSRDEVLSAVAAERPKPKPARSQGRMVRPEGGW